MNIREEREEDRDAIAAVVAAAFGSQREAALVDAIRASDNFVPALSLVAEVEGEVVAHVMLSYATLHDGDASRRILTLSPLAVAPDYQRRGIGGALVRSAVAGADERGEPLVVLEGSPAYYGRFGFEHSVGRGITIHLPSWAPPEAAQVIVLEAYDPSIGGHVVYPPAFDAVTEET